MSLTAEGYHTRDLIAATTVLAIVVLIIPIAGVTGSDGVGQTMTRAYRILDQGWSTIDVRPLYYLIVAWAVSLGHGSIESGFLADRVFFAADLAAIYLVARLAFDFRTAVCAFVFSLTAFGLHYAAGSFGGDPSVPLFPLIALAAMVYGYRSGQLWAFGAAGLSIALGVQMKETVLPLLALPILALVVPSLRRASHMKGFVAFYAAAGATMAAFLLALSHAAGVLGDAQQQHTGHFLAYDPLAQRSFALFLLRESTVGLPRNTYLYLRHFMLPYFPITPLMLLAFATALWRAFPWKGRSVSDTDAVAALCALAVVLLAPGILIQGEMGERIGHGMPIHFLLYLLTAWWGAHVVMRWSWVQSAARATGLGETRLFYAAVALGGIAQLFFPGRATLELLAYPRQHFGGHFPLTLWRDVPFTNRGRFSDHNRRIADEIARLAPPAGTVFSVGRVGDGVSFYARGRFPLKGLDYRKPLVELTEADYRRHLVGIDTYHRFRSFAPRYRSYYLYFADDFERALGGIGRAYVVLGNSRYRFFRDFLLAGAGVRTVFRSGPSVLLEVDTAKRLAAMRHDGPWISPRFRGDVAWLKAHYPAEIAPLREALARFGLDLSTLVPATASAGASEKVPARP